MIQYFQILKTRNFSKGNLMKIETRPLENFTKVSFRDFGKLILIQGSTPSLTIEADEELLPEIISEVRGDTLTLGFAEDWIERLGKMITSIFSSKNYDITYTLTVVDLSKIKISGKCDLECESLTADSLELNISGLGNMSFSHLDCNTLDVQISGRGYFSAAGRASDVNLRITGSADYQAGNLASHNMRIVISGQGEAEVRVEEKLDITISGVGHVNYYGNPKLRQVISGVGKSKRLNET